MPVVGRKLKAIEQQQEAALEQQRMAVPPPPVGGAGGRGVAAFFEQINAGGQVSNIKAGVEQVKIFGAQLGAHVLAPACCWLALAGAGTQVARAGQRQIYGSPANIHLMKIMGRAFRLAGSNAANQQIAQAPAAQNR